VTDRTDALRGPARTGLLVGTSSALFAVTLAAVASFQQDAEDATAAARAPALAAIVQRSDQVDTLFGSLDKRARLERAAVDGYAGLADGLSRLDASLEALGGEVDAVTGAAAALPDRIRLPSLSVPRTVQRPPSTHATTGASGAP
jgi:hypothetical protein